MALIPTETMQSGRTADVFKSLKNVSIRESPIFNPNTGTGGGGDGVEYPSEGQAYPIGLVPTIDATE